jgi:hypothetical protein
MFVTRRQIRRAERSEADQWIAHEAMTAGPDGAARRTTSPGVRAAWLGLG